MGRLAITILTLPWRGADRRAQLFAIGFAWLALALAFEISFGRLQGQSWPVILQAYAFRNGNVWPLVLLATLSAPYLAMHLRRRARAGS